MKRETTMNKSAIKRAVLSPTIFSASTRLPNLFIKTSICLSRMLFKIAAPAALKSKDTIPKIIMYEDGNPLLASTIPAIPVKATLSMILGFRRRRVDTRIFLGALSADSTLVSSIIFSPPFNCGLRRHLHISHE